MPRVAGSNTHYKFILQDANTGRSVSGISIELPSVTSIIGATLAKPMLVGWAYRVTRDNISGMVSELEKAEVPRTDIMEVLTDGDMLDEYLKENKLRPDDIKEDAAERGRAGHATLERLGTIYLDEAGGGGYERAHEHAQSVLDSGGASGWDKAIAAWWQEENPEIIMSEAILYSLDHQFIGTVDLVWKDKNGIVAVTDLKTRELGKDIYESDYIQSAAYGIAYAERTGGEADYTSVLMAYPDGTYVERSASFDAKAAFLGLLATYRAMKVKR